MVNATLVELETSSRGPDQQLQRRQCVYRRLGVQQALVLVQTKLFGNVVVYISVEKILDPFGQLTYSINLLL